MGELPNTLVEAEKWLEDLGMRMLDVAFFKRGKVEPVYEKQVDDPLTIEGACKMAMDRMRMRACVYPYQGRWALYWRMSGITYYDTKEAAEMVAMHKHG